MKTIGSIASGSFRLEVFLDIYDLQRNLPQCWRVRFSVCLPLLYSTFQIFLVCLLLFKCFSSPDSIRFKSAIGLNVKQESWKRNTCAVVANSSRRRQGQACSSTCACILCQSQACSMTFFDARVKESFNSGWQNSSAASEAKFLVASQYGQHAVWLDCGKSTSTSGPKAEAARA